MTEQQQDERDVEVEVEKIVPAQGGNDPGSTDGVGERVLSGMGSDGVEHLEGEFGHLDEALESDVLAPEGATEDPDEAR